MIVNGHDIPDTDLETALKSLGSGTFALRDLQTAIKAAGIDPGLSYDAAKRLLQKERKAGTLVRDAQSGLWQMAGSSGNTAAAPVTRPVAPQNPPTLPLQAANAGKMPMVTSHGFGKSQEMLRGILAHAACFAAVAALALINASFAWEVAETEVFRVAFVSGLMASDLMRPLLVARGLWDFERQRRVRGALAVGVALTLAPVSVLSSTAVISATLHLGAEEIEADTSRTLAHDALMEEYERLQQRAERTWQEWEEECSRGHCGPIASEHEATAKALDAEVDARLDEILAMSQENANERSTFLSRLVKGFGDLGLFGGATKIAIPLILALTLELAAIFGPALLLARRR